MSALVVPVPSGPSRWRRYGGAVTREPRPDGHIVQLVNLPTRFEAEAVIGMLRDHDIQAMGKYGDAEGWMPHMALLDGYRVFVFDSDLARAKELVEAEGLADGSE
jgi:hypothetical protein